MGETFYTALGVSPDADGEAIRAAYREQVKERHPDVSDDPGAPREFRRLTTARDVLVDDAERERYDRLGHATYVTRHVETSAWSASTGSGPRERSRSGGGAADAQTSRAADRSTWLGDDWDGPGERARARRSGGSSGGTGHASSAAWQQAGPAYEYTGVSVPGNSESAVDSARNVLRAVGPWLVVHLILLAGAVTTAWYTYATAGAVTPFPIPALAFGLVLVGLVLFLSALHLVTLVYV